MRLSLISAVFSILAVALGTCLQLNHFENFEYDSLSHVYDTLDRQNAPAEQFFTQQLDHFDTFNNATWKQKFFNNSAYFTNKKTGPVFLRIGGNNPVFNGVSVLSGAWVEYAKKFSALCFILEHRYYGKSQPTADLSTKNLKYLSTDQVLADIAYFIDSKRKELGLATNKWILFGSAYSGDLAAWFRLKYPHLAYGAVVSSAPLLSKVNFLEFYEGVKKGLQTAKQGPEWTDVLSDCFNTVKKYTTSKEGREIVQELFNLCDPLDPSDSSDVASLFINLASFFSNSILYNNIASGYYNTLDNLANIMSNRTYGEFLIRLSVAIDQSATMMGMDCIDYKYSNYTAKLKETSRGSSFVVVGYRQWFYQQCTEIGNFQTTDSTKQPFGNTIPISYFTKQCRDVFGIDFTSQLVIKGVDRLNLMNGGLSPTFSRVLFVDGSLNPWLALDMVNNQTGNSIVFMQGTARIADTFPSDPSDSAALKAGRNAIQAYLKTWISSNSP